VSFLSFCSHQKITKKEKKKHEEKMKKERFAFLLYDNVSSMVFTPKKNNQEETKQKQKEKEKKKKDFSFSCRILFHQLV
jgi:hypothetical protein